MISSTVHASSLSELNRDLKVVVVPVEDLSASNPINKQAVEVLFSRKKG